MTGEEREKHTSAHGPPLTQSCLRPSIGRGTLGASRCSFFHFHFEPASSASGTLPKAQSFVGLSSDVFDPAIIQTAAVTASAEASEA
jgi:hypothetical protein